ncbi:MAG: translation initiation factor IF-6 [Candidatus Woesearchaeota archaeon]
MGIELMDFNGNPNIGLYCYANDDYCLVPQSFPEKLVRKIEKTLKVDVYRTNIAGTSFLGAFLSGNENILLVPKIVFKLEIENLKKLKIKHQIIDSDLTALGNNIFVSEKIIIINPDYSLRAEKKLKEIFNLEVRRFYVRGIRTIASLIRANSQGAVISDLVPLKKQEDLKILLGVKNIETTTVNFGNQIISSGIVLNNKGLIIGSKTTGPEIMNIESALGFADY